MSIHTPTPIQELAIPQVMQGKDVLAKAETGSGKTIAFAAPVVARLEATRTAVLALILCPTRELALQVSQVVEALAVARSLKVALAIGGERMEDQINNLRRGSQIVVGTPGRVLDLVRRKLMSLAWVESVVLDEADEMLEIGFLPDVTAILSAIHAEQRQTLLFSATFPPEILKIAHQHMRSPVRVATQAAGAPPPRIRQRWAAVNDAQRVAYLRRILDHGRDNCFLVFCDSRIEVDRVWRQLRNPRYLVYPLHGGFEQDLRTRIMARFRNREIRALIATDVAARGLDVTHVDHVINFSVPRTTERYMHRIGRTGRAGAEGEAITLVTPRAARAWQAIVREGRLVVQRM